jgi:hypothetical protein
MISNRHPEFPELAARITSPEVYAQIPSLLQYSWALAKAQQGHPICSTRMARLQPAYQVDAPHIDAGSTNPLITTPRHGSPVVPMAERVVCEIAQFYQPIIADRIRAMYAHHPTGGDAA